MGPPVEVLTPPFDPSDITPGEPGEEIRSWFNGSETVARWLSGTGGGGVYLYDYLQRTSNFPNALALCLQENPDAQVIEMPTADLEVDRQITAADGLRSRLWLRGHNTRIFKDFGGAGSSFSLFTWPTDSEKIKLTGTTYEVKNPPALFGGLMVMQRANGVLIDDCEFLCSGFTTFGTKFSILLTGSQNIKVLGSTFDAAQLALGGVGTGGSTNALIANNIAKNCNDLFVSAVTGAGFSIRGISIQNNLVDGILGSGAFFVGSDGGISAADEVSDIQVCNNIVRGSWQGGFANNPNGIIFTSGVTTKRIKLSRNNFSRSDNGTSEGYGIQCTASLSEATCEDVEIDENTIGRLEVTGIEVAFLGCSGFSMRGNKLRSNRGVVLHNIRDAVIADNIVTLATSNGIRMLASDRSISGVRMHHNVFRADPGRIAYGIFIDGPNNVTAELDHNEFSGVGASSAVANMGGGTLALRVKDCEFLGAIDSSFSNGIVLAEDNY